MKFVVGDKVKVIAWCMPGVTDVQPYHLVCGKTGSVVRVRSEDDASLNSDGVYKVYLNDMYAGGRQEWWFRACDLVAIDSPCTCTNTVNRKVIGECLVHDRPDPDPVAEATGRLQALVAKLDHGKD